MNRVYDTWEKNKDWSLEDLFDNLDYQERLAIALGNLNAQVENGGFSQWQYNGYSKVHLSFLLRLRDKLNEHPLNYPVLLKALNLVAIFASITKNNYEAININDREDYEDLEEVEDKFDKLDSIYYKLENLTDEMDLLIETSY